MDQEIFSDEEYLDLIDLWHKCDHLTRPLSKFLGMTTEEYQEYLWSYQHFKHFRLTGKKIRDGKET